MVKPFVDILTSKFVTSRESNFERKVILKVQSEEVALHGDLLAACCEFQEEDIPPMIDLSEVPGISLELVADFVNFVYGTPFIVNKENSSPASQLAQRLGCSVLLEFCKKIDDAKGENCSSRLMPDVMTRIIQLQAKAHSQHTIIYHNLEIKISRFLLNLFCNFFHKKWSLPCPDSEDDFTDFTDKFLFSTAEFSSFWMYFFSSFEDLKVEHLYVCVHFASYFGFSDLQIYLQELYSQQSPSNCFERDLILANDHDDLMFIDFLTTLINNFPKFVIESPLLLSPEVYVHLASHLEHDPMINWLVESVVVSFIGFHSISTENVKRVLSVVKVSNTQVVTLYENLKPLLSCSQLFEEVTTIFGSKLLPVVIDQYNGVKDHHDTLLDYKVKQELELHRREIASCFENTNKVIAFYNTSASFVSKEHNCLERSLFQKYSNNASYIYKSNVSMRNDDSSNISHPLDGQVSLRFSSPGQGTQLGFYCDKTKVTTGVEFLKKIGSSQQVRVCNEVHEIPTTNCLVVVAFHFSTTMDVCFQIPALGVYSTTEVPCGSVLRVRLLGGGSKCTLS
ncbi:hypothetical protein RCL1_008950 [Eukaryota sp. TZLM3-RCL]